MSQILVRCFEKNSESRNQIPQEFWGVDRSPEKIYFQGRKEAFEILERLPRFGFAVVGTRQPQVRSVQLISEVLGALEGSPLIILSGFARGIDAAAHEAALKAGLPTLAVLGTGINRTYPAENAELRKDILQAGGLIVSEFEPDDSGRPDHFLRRNRLIAGWSRATWVVEASARSGAMNTATWAKQMHKNLYATPCFPGDPGFSGNQKLIDLDCATPFWEASSVGSTWIELTHHVRGQRRLVLPEALSPDSAELSAKVFELTRSAGGGEVATLLDWSLKRGWTPERFFEAAHLAIRGGSIEEKSGLWACGRIEKSREQTTSH